jgi:hypothetical protein
MEMNTNQSWRTRISLATLLAVGVSAPAMAGGNYLKSDDYKDGEEVVKVFLMDEDYSKMIGDVERNDVDFDWVWVKTADGKMKDKVKALGFDLKSAKTVSIPEVEKFSRGMVPDDTLKAVRESLVSGFKEMGIETVASGGDLTFEAVLVDYKKDSTYAVVAMVKPFVEIEARLTDNRSGETLMLVRDQSHGDDPAGAAFNFADELVRFTQ